MALNSLLKYIGANVMAENPYVEAYAVNTKQMKGMEVQFHGREKTYQGISDIPGAAFYLRPGARANVQQVRALASCINEYEIVVPIRLVYFKINNAEQDAQRVAVQLADSLRRVKFGAYNGAERKPRVAVGTITMDAHVAFQDEVGKDTFIGDDPVVVAVDAQLRYLLTRENCTDECDVNILMEC
jgi:hypothetical protein